MWHRQQLYRCVGKLTCTACSLLTIACRCCLATAVIVLPWLLLLQIGNRIKAKGLQKLRWYCQLCQKQCRDENGFKCHQTSEGHRRQMEVFGQNPDRVVEGYSEEFEASFLDHLRRA